MSLKLESLLNPAPSTPRTFGGGTQDSATQSERVPSSHQHGQHGDGSQHHRPPSRELQSVFVQAGGASPEFRRPSLPPSYSYTAMPVEPAPGLHQRQSSGSSLAQYHHASRSPEEQRRASVAWELQYEHQLAPIQSDSYTAMNHDIQMHGEPQATENIDGPKFEDEEILHEIPTRASVAAHSHELPSQAAVGLDAETLRAISEAKNEYGTRDRTATKREPSAHVVDVPKPALKKRPHPTKKGTASAVKKREPQSPAKKRKVESATQQRRISATPWSAPRKSISATPGASPTPGQRSATPNFTTATADVEEQYSEDDDDSNAVFCICRKPDNHTWMIACDGGCDDWFHGSCVNIEEQDGDLIDKYFCPNCEAKGQGHTTWKPMCRNRGCRRPARVSKDLVSKYCSDECGRDFFGRNMQAGVPSNKNKRMKTRRKDNHVDNIGQSPDVDTREDRDGDLGPLGGPIRPHELAALVSASSSVEDFRRLGTAPGFDTPPSSAAEGTSSASPEATIIKSELTDQESKQLAAIHRRKDELRRHRGLLKQREKFNSMAKQSSVRAVARFLGVDPDAEGSNMKKINELCGFDGRVRWSDAEFEQWRDSAEGMRAMAEGKLSENQAGAPKEEQQGEKQEGEMDTGEDGDDDPSHARHNDGSGTTTTTTTGATTTVCLRKRCEKHKNWQKLALQEIRFDEANLGDDMRALDREERDLTERVVGRTKYPAAVAPGDRGQAQAQAAS